MLRKIASPFLLILFVSLSVAQTQNQNQQNRIYEICAVSNLPGGYVIVGKTTSDACRANADLAEKDNAILIKKAGPREIICEKTPYPGGYAVVARTRSQACPNKSDENYNNAWIIEIIR
jgi:hypothetical protein